MSANRTKQGKSAKSGQAKQKISIFGLGYVGAVSSACFAQRGHTVIGVDPDRRKVDTIMAGKSPIVEDGLGQLIGADVKRGLLVATSDARRAVLSTDISMVCVGTPSAEDGSCDLKYLRQVALQIGAALREKDDYHVVVFRSTIPPGTTRKVLQPIIERTSGKQAGEGFGLCFHPEFLRESTAIDDFFAPPKTVVGSVDARGAEQVAELYRGIDDAVNVTTLEVAETVKYVDNTWHALKVSFANEIGKLCQAAGVDSHGVMDIFVQDTKLNLSPYYLKPGFAFGGSCLPKDVRGINHLAGSLGVETPVLGSIIASNDAQIDHAVSLINKTDDGVVGFLGVTFKKGTDDLRESPVLQVISKLLHDGRQVRIHDPNLDLGSALRHHLQHSRAAKGDFAEMMKKLPDLVCGSASDLVSVSDTIVVSHKTEAFRTALCQRHDTQRVIDLIRVFDGHSAAGMIAAVGMNGYVQKPANKAEILEALAHWGAAGKTERQRVLLAEDNPVNRNVIQLMLEREGHRVDTVENGAEAVRAAKSSSYDLIFMDLSMPVMDGLSAARAIRGMAKARSSVPIVALTALAAPEASRTYTGICW